VPLKIDFIEHSVHVSHISLGVSVVRSFFHALSSFFAYIFTSVFSFVSSFLEDYGMIIFFDSVFVFIFLKFFMCSSNALVLASGFYILKSLI